MDKHIICAICILHWTHRKSILNYNQYLTLIELIIFTGLGGRACTWVNILALLGIPPPPCSTNHTYIHTHIKIFIHMQIIVLIFCSIWKNIISSPIYDNTLYTQSAYCTGLIGQVISKFHWDNNLYWVGRQGTSLGKYIGLIGNPPPLCSTNYTYIHTHTLKYLYTCK